ncbi:hypothetical protein TraAM80_02506 [Trypanosoma rangeli]|uniref:FYVE-type domain-containing protein n=1 Tax=Trypanosoma rangeli TaxID=5698 RepID=A0A422NUE3_TRYRA|nr:uncharacterized protein TraAM80_02506 [Trypanosoma rangeli]RNF09074.1 hypothetical protein TraAM80_02506 [Trypanosoma rangeli]|eukprot:RNF09074.1 hypothetical protein TraAM80_02506 [Trypanosoma rangeli]
MENLLRVVPEIEWCNKSEVGVCQRPGCGRSFGLLSKPANCHACGSVMCSHCLERNLTLPGKPGSAPVPLCHACAICVSKVQAEAEIAYQQRGEMLQRLNEQQVELERLLTVSSSLREENQRLVELTEALGAEVGRLKLNSSVEEAPLSASPTQEQLTKSPLQADVRSPSGRNIGTVDDNSNEDRLTAANTNGGRTLTAEEAALAEEMRARQNVWSRREVALREATKKVTSDAAQLAALRTQLRKEERGLRAEFTQKFQVIVEDELLRLQRVYMGGLTDLGEQFEAWRRAADDVLKTVKLQHEHSHGNVALPAALCSEKAQVEEALTKARALHMEDMLKAKKQFDNGALVLESALGVARREVAAEKRQREATQRTVDELTLTLWGQQQRHEVDCAEWCERLAIVDAFHGLWRQLQSSPSSVATRQGELTDHTAAAIRAILSEWRWVAKSLLSQHGASLSAITLVAAAACSPAEFPSPSPPTQPRTAATASAASDTSEHAEEPAKFCRELSSPQRLSKGFEEQPNEDAVEVVFLKRMLALKTEELQQLRAKLSRTEKALVVASRVERHVSQQLQQQRQREQKERLPAAQDNSSTSAFRFVTDMMHHGSLYVDGCIGILSDALLRLYDVGVQEMQELARRGDLTRRSMVALEETTASIKAFPEDLKRREAAVARTEWALQAREQESQLRLSRLVKVSVALRTVAERLRAASTSEEASRHRNGCSL